MLPSIEKSRLLLNTIPIVISGVNAMALCIFMFPIFVAIPARFILTATTIFGMIGLLFGMYIKYRSTLAISHCCFYMAYFLFVMEFLFGVGSVIMAVHIGGRPDLYRFVLGVASLSMLLALLAGIFHQALALRLFDKDDGQFWRGKLGRYIDDRGRIINCDFGNRIPIDKGLLTLGLVVAINIPLLFEFYGGERNNVVILAAPMLIGTFIYLNLSKIGPWIVQLYLLRKLEKSFGCRFINADYEQIQALRRTFFLSRWLMKDYIGHQIADLEPSVEPKRKVRAVRRMHLRKRR